MKKVFLYSVALLTAGSLMFTSCVDDLNTEPLSENVITADVAFASPESYAQYANYAYAYFAFVSQGDPGTSDIAVDNAGQSEFVRQYMAMNEMSADSFQVIDAWSDDYVKPLQYGYWSGTNAALMAVYLRGLKAIAMCNQFLDPAVSGDAAVTARGHESVLADVQAYRSELRLLRSVYYAILLDFFGNPPVVTLESLQSGTLPKQLPGGRAELFGWIENELLELTADPNLPATPIAYPRLSKGAAWAVLARLYLNAEVYTGTARWSDAKTAAEKVITEGGYELCNNYKYLFLQDNTTNGAQKEFIVAAMYDAVTTPSWGGTTHLISATVSEKMKGELHKLFGLTSPIYNDSWNGYHISDDFVMKHFDLQEVDWNTSEVSWGYNVEKSDKRAAFYNHGFTKEFTNERTDVHSGWGCLKWVPLDSNNRSQMVEENLKNSSADFPIFRLAEMYLISAEAEARMGNGTLSVNDPGYKRIQRIRQRANGASDVMPATIDLDYILEERVRELYWEGHRRTDLIRYGYFLTATYPWPYKGGVPNGVIALDSHREVYPIISSDMITNGALEQNEGYPHH